MPHLPARDILRTMPCSRSLPGFLSLATLASVAGTAPPSPLDWSIRAGAIAQTDPSGENPALDPGVPGEGSLAHRAERAWGEVGGQWLTFGAGVASDLSDAEDAYGFAQWSTFLDHRVEWAVQLGGWALETDDERAPGVSLATFFKWHFLERDRLTLFGEIGIGILLAGEQVPDGGTNVNFLPTVGGGATYRLSDSGMRLVTGLRWHHISNARIVGDDSNPARDGLMLYAGIAIPL